MRMFRHVKRGEPLHQRVSEDRKHWDVFVMDGPAAHRDWRSVKAWCEDTFQSRDYVFAVSLVMISNVDDAFAFKMRWV